MKMRPCEEGLTKYKCSPTFINIHVLGKVHFFVFVYKERAREGSEREPRRGRV